MINKRLLIKNLLAYTHENSFYDKKRRLELETREGKSKFLKHICALSNANPNNNSYLVVGIEDADNTIVGVDFFGDFSIFFSGRGGLFFECYVTTTIGAQQQREIEARRDKKRENFPPLQFGEANSRNLIVFIAARASRFVKKNAEIHFAVAFVKD
jgi:hypothetical protein